MGWEEGYSPQGKGSRWFSGCSGAWMPSLGAEIFGDCGQARQGQRERFSRDMSPVGRGRGRDRNKQYWVSPQIPKSGILFRGENCVVNSSWI